MASIADCKMVEWAKAPPIKEVVFLYFPKSETCKTISSLLSATRNDSHKYLIQEVDDENILNPVHVTLCRILFRIVPEEFWSIEDDADQLRAIPKSLIDDFISDLKKLPDWWESCWKKDTNFIDEMFALYLFSHSFAVLKKYLTRVHIDRTLSFSGIIRKNLERTILFDNEGFLTAYEIYLLITDHPVTFAAQLRDCGETRILKREAERCLDLIKYNVTYQSKGSASRSLDLVDQRILSTLISLRLQFPGISHDKIKHSIFERPSSVSVQGFHLYLQTWIEIGDMIYTLNFVTMQSKYFAEVSDALDVLFQGEPLISHKEVIGRFMENLAIFPTYKEMSKAAMARVAINFYKTWWYTAHFRSSYSRSVYDLAIEWHVRDLLLDRNAMALNGEAALRIVQKEMLDQYPAYPFNSAHAMSVIFHLQRLNQKKAGPPKNPGK